MNSAFALASVDTAGVSFLPFRSADHVTTAARSLISLFCLVCIEKEQSETSSASEPNWIFCRESIGPSLFSLSIFSLANGQGQGPFAYLSFRPSASVFLFPEENRDSLFLSALQFH